MTSLDTYGDDDFLTPGEVAALFRVDPKTVSRWARAGLFPDRDGRPTVIRTLGGHIRVRFKVVRMVLTGEITMRYTAEPTTEPTTPDLPIPENAHRG